MTDENQMETVENHNDRSTGGIAAHRLRSAFERECETLLRDLDFTVLSEEKIPEELKTVIAEKGTEPFQLTYSDNQNLYISIGYGEQKTGGYSIAVDALYLTDDAIHVSTSLLGPDITGQKEGAGKPSTPYIVLKTELLDKTVLYD